MSVRQVRDVMTENVVVVRPGAGFKQIADTLAKYRVSAVPVVDDTTHVVGVVSEADLLHKVEYAGTGAHVRLLDRPSRRTAKEKAAGETAAELMSAPAVTVPPDATIGEAARLMERHGVKRVPVVTAEGALVGIVSRRDLLRPYLRSDAEIHDEIVEQVLRHTMWMEPGAMDIDVHDGRVRLAGRLDRRSTAQIIGSLVRGLDGIVTVTNDLTWDFDDTVAQRRPAIFDPDLREPHDLPW